MGGKMGGTGFKAPRERGLPRIPAICLLASLLAASGTPAFAQVETPACTPVIARVVSLQGTVEVQRAGTANWLAVRRLDTSICAGDRLRTAASSRAMLYVQPETLVRLDQHTTLVLQQSTDEISVEFSADEVSRVACTEETCGAGYFITRFPKKFKVKTPHMNAAVEGTEFMVEMNSEGTKLTVLEGKVSSQSTTTGESRLVAAGQSLASGTSGAGVIATVVKPQDAVQWVLRYPPISDGSGASRAEELLRVGSVEEALTVIDSELSADPRNSDALALRAVIQVAKNDKAGALQSAGSATAANAANYRSWLAMSYSQQASFDLDAALESALKAKSLAPESALADARVAELYLSLGESHLAERAAHEAVAANPDESHALSILGFVHLAEVDTPSAKADFQAAIERDSFSALPRLGLGLAMIRNGELKAGREQIEIAVALDPSNSLLRSYVGKAYYEENSTKRDRLAAAQFQLAKELDPRDPTPWFYDAFLHQSRNRPVSALQELQTSVERNDNRAVYRSRLMVEDDAAARTAGVAGIYDDLGFEKLAIVESTKALATNAANHSAHQQLASAYANLPRHDISRVSEALQAQIRQPVSLATVGPQLSTDNLVISKDTGPARPGTSEFNLLFNQNDVRLQFDGIVGNLDTYGDQFVASALVDNVSYTLSQLHYETDGFVDNDAAEKDIYDFILHGQLSPKSSVQVDVKHAEFSIGQTFFPFDEFPTPTTIAEQSDTLRLSGHHLTDAVGDWIWSAAVEDRKRAVRSFPDGGLFTKSDTTPYAAEGQFTGQVGVFQVVAGAGYIEEDEHFGPDPSNIRTQSANVYAYGQWNATRFPVSVQAGLAAEWLEARSSAPDTDDTDPIDRDRLSPKLGLVWTPRTGTTVRAAAFSSVRRPFIRSQTIEPTQVAGFNQFFTGFEQVYGDLIGTVSDRIGAAIDQAFNVSTFGGIEVSKRRLEVPSAVFDRDFTWREEAAHAYLYKTFAPGAKARWSAGLQTAVSAELEYEDIERPQALTGSEGIMDLETVRIPFGVQFFSESGTTLRAATTYVRQDGVFSIDVGLPIVETRDDTWITDLSIEYRLPNRRGVVAIGVRNIFDESIDLLEVDPLNVRVATRRFVFGTLSFVF